MSYAIRETAVRFRALTTATVPAIVNLMPEINNKIAAVALFSTVVGYSGASIVGRVSAKKEQKYWENKLEELRVLIEEWDHQGLIAANDPIHFFLTMQISEISTLTNVKNACDNLEREIKRLASSFVSQVQVLKKENKELQTSNAQIIVELKEQNKNLRKDIELLERSLKSEQEANKALIASLKEEKAKNGSLEEKLVDWEKRLKKLELGKGSDKAEQSRLKEEPKAAEPKLTPDQRSKFERETRHFSRDDIEGLFDFIPLPKEAQQGAAEIAKEHQRKAQAQAEMSKLTNLAQTLELINQPKPALAPLPVVQAEQVAPSAHSTALGGLVAIQIQSDEQEVAKN